MEIKKTNYCDLWGWEKEWLEMLQKKKLNGREADERGASGYQRRVVDKGKKDKRNREGLTNLIVRLR